MASSGRQLEVMRKREKTSALDKRVPRNPRYKHVRSVLDTGSSMSKYLEKVEEIRQNYRFRPGEIFKRLKCTTFAHMVLQVFTFVEPDDLLPMPAEPEASEAEASATCGADANDDAPLTPGRTTTLAQVTRGIGEKDDSTASHSHEEPLSSIPFLLLDVRNKDDYDKCHVITARNYPAPMLSRSCNYFTREILQYKNAPGKVIILYDEDERIAAECAEKFVQRDVSNVFMLSGGLKVLFSQFPQGMITGVIPASVKPSPKRSAASRNSAAGSRVTAASCSGPATSRQSSVPSRKTSAGGVVDDEGDLPPPSRPLVTPPPPRDPNLVPHPGWYTVEDIQNIEDQLDEVLLNGGRNASQMSSSRASASTASSRMSAASTQSTQRSVPSGSSRLSKASKRPT